MPNPATRAFFHKSIKASFLFPLAVVAACSSTQNTAKTPQASQFQTIQTPTIRSLAAGKASFARAKSRMMPIIRSACREAHKKNAKQLCDFRVAVVSEGPRGPSARMSFDAARKPMITFNHAMLRATQSDDELAMVLAHESSHQILRHIERRALGVLSAAGKNSKIKGATLTEEAKKRAVVAYVAYSQAFELEADRLAAQMILRGGYAPTHALQFLDRLPENANRVTLHPKHPARIYEVESISRRFLEAEANGRKLPYAY